MHRPRDRLREEQPLEPFDIVTAPYDALNWVTDQVFLLMNGLFERFGLPIVFFAALAEATVLVGVVFPGVVLIFLGGAYAASEGASVPYVLAIAIAGTVLGDSISYTVGRLGGSFLAGTRLEPTLRVARAVIAGRARWLIPFYHLNSVTRAVGPFGAGTLRVPLRVWMPLDYLGAIIANSAWVGAGVIFGRALLTDDGTLRQHPALRIGLAIGAVAWLLLVQRQLLSSARSERAAQQEDADEVTTVA